MYSYTYKYACCTISDSTKCIINPEFSESKVNISVPSFIPHDLDNDIVAYPHLMCVELYSYTVNMYRLTIVVNLHHG